MGIEYVFLDLTQFTRCPRLAVKIGIFSLDYAQKNRERRFLKIKKNESFDNITCLDEFDAR